MNNEKRNIRHIVLFKLFDGVDEATELEALGLLKQLGENNNNILSWTVERSLDTRKGVVIIENSLFKNTASLQEFRHSAKHAEVSGFMKQISAWLVGDYEV